VTERITMPPFVGDSNQIMDKKLSYRRDSGRCRCRSSQPTCESI